MRATVPSDLWVMPSIMAVAIDGCLSNWRLRGFCKRTPINPTHSGSGCTGDDIGPRLSRSPSCRSALTATKALCCPKLKSKGMKASPCSPPSPWNMSTFSAHLVPPQISRWTGIELADERVCTMCATHSVPARVESAYWNGCVAASASGVNCCAIVRATTLRNTSPTNIPRTPPSGFARAVIRPSFHGLQHLFGHQTPRELSCHRANSVGCGLWLGTLLSKNTFIKTLSSKNTFIH